MGPCTSDKGSSFSQKSDFLSVVTLYFPVLAVKLLIRETPNFLEFPTKFLILLTKSIVVVLSRVRADLAVFVPHRAPLSSSVFCFCFDSHRHVYERGTTTVPRFATPGCAQTPAKPILNRKDMP